MLLHPAGELQTLRQVSGSAQPTVSGNNIQGSHVLSAGHH